MSRARVYGRAYKISEKDAKAYRRTDRPKRMKANPMGVTSMASVNGRGAYSRSARQVAAGKSKKQRLDRARKVLKNGESKAMAGFLKNTKRKSRSPGAAKRLAAAKRAGSRTTTKRRSTSSSSTRRKVPGTSYYRTAGGRYQNAQGKYVSESRVKAAKSRSSSSKKKTTAKRKTTTRKKTTARRTVKRNATAKRTTTTRRTAAKRPVRRNTTTKRKTTAKRRVKRNASAGYSASYGKGYDAMKRSQAAKKAAATRKRRAAAAARASGRKASVGRYKRVRVTDPKTGKSRLSYMYETRGGKRRRIPASAITKSGHMSKAQVKRGRSKAAARVKKEGTAFVANKRSSARQKRAGRRLAAFMAAKRSGKNVKQAKAAALRKVPLATGDSFKGTTKVGPMRKGSKKRVRVAGRKRTLVANKRRRKTTRKNTRRKTTAKRRVVRRNGNTTTMKNNRRRRTTAAKRRRTTKRTYKANRRRSPVRRRTTRRRRMTRNAGRHTYRKNQFLANLGKAFQSGLIVATGFMTHRVLTNLLCDKVPFISDMFAENAALNTWRKPIIGAAVMLAGVPLVGAIKPLRPRAIEIGAGMVASWLQSAIVSAFAAAEYPDGVNAVQGYSNSRAYALRGTRRRRRGLRGGHQTSIMPRYAPVSGLGQYEQAAAGYQQAAAGFQQAAAGTGEYFAPNATGEYFAPNNLQGVGEYEAAGQLAMQAAAGTTSQHIDDGIRPDSDLDRQMDIMEAAAGMRGMGEYYEATAHNVEQRVGQQSQWIPKGALWAGERQVNDTQMTSELSAGILQKQGGNGVLSAG